VRWRARPATFISATSCAPADEPCAPDGEPVLVPRLVPLNFVTISDQREAYASLRRSTCDAQAEEGAGAAAAGLGGIGQAGGGGRAEPGPAQIVYAQSVCAGFDGSEALRTSGGNRHPLEQVLVAQHQSSVIYHQIRFKTAR
jgi:hypothetical protein